MKHTDVYTCMLISSHTFQYQQKVQTHAHTQIHEHKPTLNLGPLIYKNPQALLVWKLTTKGQPQPVTNVAMCTKQSSTQATKAWIH